MTDETDTKKRKMEDEPEAELADPPAKLQKSEPAAVPQSQPATATDTDAAAVVEGVAETPAAPAPESKVETAPVAVVAPVATPAPVPVDVAVTVAATETSAENGQEQPAPQTKQEPTVAVLFPKATLITATTPAPIAAQFIRIPIAAVQAPAPAPVPVENKASLPPGVPTGVPMGVPMAIHNHTAAPPPAPGLGSVSTSNPNTGGPPQTQNQPSNSNPNAIISEKADLPVLYVGRIIGKGGEQIRDLQARSSCKIDVDQNVPHGQPRVITYQGPRDKIEFAKQLVGMLCCDNWKNVDLPLGFATRVKLQVPSHVIGKIIGRGGEMIKELQFKSYANLQVEHNVGVDSGTRTITVTGNELSVKKAEEMINLIVANPMGDASANVDMLIREKSQGTSEWGSGPPYSSMPNNGVGITGSGGGYGGGGGGHGHGGGGYGGQSHGGGGSGHGGGGYGGGGGGQNQGGGYGGGGQHGQSQYGNSGGGYQQQQPHQQTPPSHGGNVGHYGTNSGGAGGLQSEVFHAAKMYMGRIIGSKGVTINDLQKKSGCDIQINQNVPFGQDCEINMKGTKQGIDSAKQMLNSIIQMGSNHPYAGGQAGGGGGGGGYQQNQQGSYGGHGQQQPSYGQQQPQPQYQQQPQQVGYQPYGQQQQQTQQQPMYGGYQQPVQQQPAPQTASQPQYGGYQQPVQQHSPAQRYGGYQPPPAPVPDWKAAKAPDGQTYYYNEKTNETTWDKPPGMP